MIKRAHLERIVAENLPKDLPGNETYLVGYADLDGLLTKEYANYKSGISLVRKINDEIIDNIADHPTNEYLDLYHTINQELAQTAERIAAALNKEGIAAIGVMSQHDDVEKTQFYLDNLRVALSHKMTAVRAGLGWIGKTDLFVSPQYGPRVRLASVLLEDAIDEPGAPMLESRCGSCQVCVAACPAQTASGELWEAGMQREEFFDAFACRDYCKAASKDLVSTVSPKEAWICGRCVSVCPRGKRKASSSA